MSDSNARAAAMALALLTLVGCRGEADLARLPPSEPATGDGLPLVVETLRAERRPLSRAVVATGSTRPLRAANLSPESQGIIERLYVEEGSQVEEGQILARLDGRTAQLQAAQARAAASAAKVTADQMIIEHERIARLAEEGAVPRSKATQLRAQRDAVDGQARAARAAAQLASHVARNAILRAPFAGTVSMVMMEQGEFASMMPPRPILRLIDLSRFEVRVRVNERDLARISEGDAVRAHLPSLDLELDGRVTFVGLEVHPLTRTAEVVTTFDNPDRRVRGGLFAEVTIQPAAAREAIVLPERSLGGSGDERYVFVVEGCTARRRPVEVFGLEDGRVEVRDGLQSGELVVADGSASLTDGAAVAPRGGDCRGRTSLAARAVDAAVEEATR